MTATTKTLVVSLGLLTAASHADLIRLNDGTVYQGQLDAPVSVTIKTADGNQVVPFAQLPAHLQAAYWKTADAAALATGPVQNDELAALAASVKLKTWSLVTAYGSFRDKPER